MKEEKKPIENELSLPKEMPKREEKIVNIKYPDGTNCDVIKKNLLKFQEKKQ